VHHCDSAAAVENLKQGVVTVPPTDEPDWHLEHFMAWRNFQDKLALKARADLLVEFVCRPPRF